MKQLQKVGLIICFLGLVGSASASVVNIRILTRKVVKSFIFSSLNGNYILFSEGKVIGDCDASGIFQMTLDNDSILLKTFESTIGKFPSITIRSKNINAGFKIKSLIPDSKIRSYDGDLEVNIASDSLQFQLVNNVELEKYIAGVVESESGTRNKLEYYKIQAILVRTYLLAHLDRHILDGFQVCDEVHCQAYLRKSRNAKILKAVEQTKGMVIVDRDLNLITAAFHSNCGGQTVASEDVWFMATSYLKSRKDTFCLYQPHATWTRKILLEDWLSYLQLKHNMMLNEQSNEMANQNKEVENRYSTNGKRGVYFVHQGLNIPLKEIRKDFKLKSTFFTVKAGGEHVILTGRGYGHGVGLCQEGAMKMAEMNYTATQILHFYYKDVNLIDLKALNYFRKE